MATKRVKNEDERLDDAHIERVINLLEPKEGKPGTKKRGLPDSWYRIQCYAIGYYY